MNDAAFSLLINHLNSLPNESSGLWIVDENISAQQIAQIRPRSALQVLTNRYTTAQQLEQAGFSCHLSDFDFTAWPDNYFDGIFYRVSKEKPVVHHIINNANDKLKQDTVLHLCGFKNEGTKTYIDKAESYLGDRQCFERGKNAAMLASIVCHKLDNPNIDDKNYSQSVCLASESIRLVSKPGVYGWNKIDKGSQFLIEQLPAVLKNRISPPTRIADLGCGYGYLSVMAAQQIDATFYASDNNCAAVKVCRENFALNDLAGDVFLDDAGSAIGEKVDLVLCNPPFHQGFETDGDLTVHFLQSAKSLLANEGSALFVVNSFIPIEKKSRGIFESVEVLANNNSFKVCLLR